MQLPYEMRQAYLDRRKKELVVLKDACRNSEFSTLIRIGHQLKGNALPFGFDELNALGARLENTSKEGDLKEASLLVEKIKNYIESYRFSDDARQ